MIRVFNHTETNFTHNGIHVLDDIVIGDACILTNEINGVYSLECELSMFNNSKWKDIENEMFLRVPTPKGEQLFRIKEIVKGFSTLKIYGKHVFFDLENNFILDTNIVQKDGRTALTQILGGMSNNMLNTYYGTSDISIINNSRLVRKNVVTALIGADDNSYLNRWGGELDVDNFNFSINKRLGSDNGFQIRYGKNCTGYEGNVNTYNLCTRIVPVGYDGLMLEGTKWVDSPNIAKYPQIYTQEIKYDYIKVKNNPDDEEGYSTIEEARAALKQEALNTFSNTKCDLPTFSARVNFITLENTEEYKDVRFLEKVELGDDVSIYLSSIDVNASSRIVKTKYNFFAKKYIEVELGDIKPNIFKQIINIKDTIDSIIESLGGNTWQDIINKSLDEATKLMEEGLKDSHVINMKNQIVIGDAPDIKDMVNCIVINKNGIGFSNNGYLPDRLISAMTIDGKINASCIKTGELNANLIKAGTLSSISGDTWIDINTGEFNFTKGIINLNSNGITTEHIETNTKTNLTSEGLSIIDKNSSKELAYFGKNNNAYISELKASSVVADNVMPIIRDKGNVNIYVRVGGTGTGTGVDSNNRASSITNALEQLAIRWGLESNQFTKGIMLKNTTVIVNCDGSTSYSENVLICNIRGGSINLTFDKACQITGTITFKGCDNPYVIGCKSSIDTNDGALFNRNGSGNALSFLGCKVIQCRSFRMYNSVHDGRGIDCYWGGALCINSVDIYGFYIGVAMADGGVVNTCNVIGHGMTYGVYLNYGSRLTPLHKYFNNTSSYNNGSYWVQDDSGYGFTATNSIQVAPPTPTVTSQTNSFSGHTYKSVRPTYTTEGVFNQSHYNSPYGAWTGYVYFTGVSDWLSDSSGTPTAKIFLHRKNTAHGYPTGARPYLVGYGFLTGDSTGATGLAQGGSDWFTIPATIVNELKAGTRNYLSFTESTSQHYILFETNAVLKVTASKPN